jgi:hypothetical protein
MLRAVRALAEALFATLAGPPPADRLDWLVQDLDDFLGRSGARSRVLLRLSLLAVSVVAPLMVFRLQPLRALPLDRRTEALERFERSFFALPLFALKAILCVLYYEHPDAAREIGFDGACMVEAKR